MGKPIVTLGAGGLLKAIVHEVNGLMVRNDVYEICSAIRRMLTNVEFARACGENAMKTVEKGFIVNSMAKRFLEIYQS